VRESRCAISSTKTADSNSPEAAAREPSGAMTAEMPLVEASATERPNSTARTRAAATCCSLSAL
jgi:hypothetical protein